MSLRIGQIDYANCVPLFRALQTECPSDHYSYVRGVPATLNRLLARGEIDLSPSSSIVYGSDPEHYWLLPGLSISTTGPVKSVLLFSQKPLDQLQGSKIGLTTESDTSVALLRIILKRYCGFENVFQRTDQPLTEAFTSFTALLLIGDAALRESLRGHACHVYDLGELWYRFTGHPFVFALWIANRAAVAGRHADLQGLARTLHHAKEIARTRLISYAADQPGFDWISKGDLAAYWQTISYDLGAKQIAGLKSFFQHAAELGIIPRCPGLVFFPEC